MTSNTDTPNNWTQGGQAKSSDATAAMANFNAFTPRNPFTLPELGENEVIYPPSLVGTACSLSAHYIAARRQMDAELAYRFDQDIGAFLSEEFQTRDEQAVFRSRFLTLYADCNAVFGSLNHWHCNWAYDTDRF